jgi:hypothetical protein
VSVGGETRWSKYVERRLDELVQLPVDPVEDDMYPRPAPEVLREARSIAWLHFAPDTPTPSVLPTMERGVLFVWHKGGWDIELEVALEGASVWAHNRSKGGDWEGSLDDTSQRLAHLLASLDVDWGEDDEDDQ